MERRMLLTAELNAPAGSRLMNQVRGAIRSRHYSYRTEQAYVHWIKRFIHFHGLRHPQELGEPEVTAFLNHLGGSGVAATTQNKLFPRCCFSIRRFSAARSTGLTNLFVPSGRPAFRPY